MNQGIRHHKNNRLRRLMRLSAEVVVTLVLVLIFFGAFTTLLFRMFPMGIKLSQIIEKRKGEERQGSAQNGERGSIISVSDELSERMAAKLTGSENEVKSKSATSLVWGAAKIGMQLYDHDAVQTFDQSSAKINFDPRNYLTLGSNSLVIIKKIEKITNRNQRRSAMVMVEGELLGKITSSGSNPLDLEITTPSAVSRITSGPGGKRDADFRISINPDKSSSIVVYKGQAEVTAQGRTVRINKGSGVTVKQGQAPKAPVPLPPAPALSLPGNRSTIYFRESAPKVRMAWNGSAGEAYHLQVARDAAFKEMVIDKKVSEPQFVHGNLKKGNFYWRVSKIEEGREGEAGEVRIFDLSQELAPPELQVKFPGGPVGGDHALISGKTTPGVRVYVSGKPAAIDASGDFSHEVAIRSGMNLITVEAINASGNVTYRSQYVQGR